MSNIQQKTILLVEDEVIIALSQAQDLENEGYTVVHAASGEKAIEYVCVRKEPVDLILMDIDLGKGIDGTEAAKEILKSYDIPVVFLSSHTEKEMVEKTEKITSYGYVVKSSSLTVLDASIKMAFKLFNANHVLSEKNESLHQHSQLLENIIENIPGFVLWKDTHSVFLGSNTNFAHKCGIASPAEIIGKSDYDLPFFNDEIETFIADDRFVMQTGLAKMHFEEREHVANKEEIFLDTCKIPLFDAEGKVSGILAVAMDITARKHEEAVLRESEEKFRLLYENMDNGVFYELADGTHTDI